MNPPTIASDDTYLKSTFYEQLVKHVFISEVLQEVWYSFGKTAEVLYSEVDASGYDVVFDCNGVLRHVQIKTSKPDAKARGQKVNLALAEKPSGCVVWVLRQEDLVTRRMSLSYRFFGDDAGKPLPSLHGFKIAKHTKGNRQGVKNQRTAIRVVPKSRFVRIPTTRELVGKLFGLRSPLNNMDQQGILIAAEKEAEDE